MVDDAAAIDHYDIEVVADVLDAALRELLNRVDLELYGGGLTDYVMLIGSIQSLLTLDSGLPAVPGDDWTVEGFCPDNGHTSELTVRVFSGDKVKPDPDQPAVERASRAVRSFLCSVAKPILTIHEVLDFCYERFHGMPNRPDDNSQPTVWVVQESIDDTTDGGVLWRYSIETDADQYDQRRLNDLAAAIQRELGRAVAHD